MEELLTLWLTDCKVAAGLLRIDGFTPTAGNESLPLFWQNYSNKEEDVDNVEYSVFKGLTASNLNVATIDALGGLEPAELFGNQRMDIKVWRAPLRIH